MCPSIRYPEAFPLKNISAKTIVNHLTKMFTSYGIPQEIQSDRGTNFTSKLFTDVLNQLGIKQTLSTAYHPESQGSLERWHQTLKSMIKKFCFESGSDWDESIPFLLFAIRETPQESLGCSPFELLFGRQVRGPLKVVKDQWLQPSSSSSSKTVSEYLTNLKDVLSKVRQFAKENLEKTQHSMKACFDLKTKVRKFKPGDLVLAYFPIPGSPLQAKYNGPYEVIKCVNDNNYIIKTPDRRKSTQLVHINLLKIYQERKSRDVSKRAIQLCTISPENLEEEQVPPCTFLKNSEIIHNS